MINVIAALIVGVIASFTVGTAVMQEEEIMLGTSQTSSAWFFNGTEIQAALSTWGLRVPALSNCDTIDTDGDGVFSCGVDDGGTAQLDYLSQIGDVSTTSLATYDVLYYDGSGWVPTATSSWGGGASTFVGLSDTPANFTDASGKWVAVNGAGDALEFVATSTLSLTESQITDLAHYTDSDIDGTEAAFSGWDKDESDDWATTSVDYWETEQTARTADDLSDNDTDDLSEGSTNLYNQTHTGEVTGATVLTLANGVVNGNNISTTTVLLDGEYLTYVDATDNWTSKTCAEITGSADLCDGVDNTAAGGDGLSTSTDIVDTYVIYGTSNSTVGGEAAFVYDDATNVLTVPNASTTYLTVATSIDLMGDYLTDITGTGLTLSGTTLALDTTYTDNRYGTSSRDYWLANDATLAELSDVDGSQSTWDLLYWDGDSWNNTATTSWDTDTDTTCDGETCDVTNTGTLDGFEGVDFLTTALWYATTTDGLDEGSTNLYNQTHTSEVTGATALTIASGVVDSDNIANNTIIGDDLSTTTVFLDGELLSYVAATDNFTSLTCAEITGSADLCDGDDEAGSGDGWATTSADYWATNDLKLEELSDVDGSQSAFDFLMWDGDSWNNTATSTFNIDWTDLVGVPTDWTGTLDGYEASAIIAAGFSTTSADYWLANDATLAEHTDVDGSQSENDILYWDGDSWANTATTSWDTDSFPGFTDIDTDYGNEVVSSYWNFNGSSTGAMGEFDTTFGDVSYGALRVGRSGIYSSSFSASNLDLGGAILIRQESNIDVENDPGIEFAIMEGGNTVRLAIPESGADNATAFIRSGTFAGPYSSTIGNDIVSCDQWTAYDSNIDCDTGGTGADLFVQDDIELEGELFTSGTIHMDADDASQLTISAANMTGAQSWIFPDDTIASGDLMVGTGAGTFGYTAKSAIDLSDFNDDLTHYTDADTSAYITGSTTVPSIACGDGEILEFNTTGDIWECGTDDTGGAGVWTDEGTWLRPTNSEGIVVGASSTLAGTVHMDSTLGIGTSTPAGDLHIVNEGAAAMFFVENDGGQWVRFSAGSVGASMKFSDTGTFSIGAVATKDDVTVVDDFVVDGTNNGYVGINDTSPTSLLTVGATDAFQINTNGDIVAVANTTGSWDDGGIDIPTGDTYAINGVDMLTVDTLGSSVLTSSLTTVGTIGTGVWNGTAINTTYILDDTILNADLNIDVEPEDADYLQYDSTGDNFTWRNATELVADIEAAIEAALDTLTALTNVIISTALEIPNGTGPTTDAAGEIALDTTDNQLVIADSGDTARVFATAEHELFSVTVASTSEEFVSGGSLPMPLRKDGFELTQFHCYVESGTSVVLNMSDGTNDTETITCATTATSDTDVATNDTFTAAELPELQFGTITGTVDYVSFTAYGHIVRE